ncbi:Cell division topological specificity factor [Granulosicoccus antarcticus IMCC3135]|uniref:Cell division topological specificity factor n=1 Tax=Granulosicoccus antarcticus IMCC3135 TaxID=1192854 RepID=A0A2Z2P5H4_9GAMM|nr:Cell division topological specificity factor [Granulosicoccus antarcticus IMCC3135]
MGFFKFFKTAKEDQSAKVAKDRLQVLIAHERTGRDGPDYLPMLKQDILDVIKKYVAVGDDAVSVQLESQDNCDVLELNITLPELDESEDDVVPSSAAKRRAMERRQAAAQEES